MNVRKALAILIIGLSFNLKYTEANTAQTPDQNLKTTTNPGYLRVVQGSGRVTTVSPLLRIANTTTARSMLTQRVSTGGYNPSTRKLILEVRNRQIELLLRSPLTDNSRIAFSVPRVSRECEASTLTYILNPALWINRGFQTDGTLIKRGSVIQGTFVSRGGFSFSDQSKNLTGQISGQFSLVMAAGTAANIPSSYRNYRTLTSLPREEHQCY